jgi:hypothetical protein
MKHFKTESSPLIKKRQPQDWKVIQKLLPYLAAYNTMKIIVICT